MKVVRFPWALALAGVLVLAAVAFAAGAFRSNEPVVRRVSPQTEDTMTLLSAESVEPTVQPTTVEVPDVADMRREDAEVVLKAAGLAIVAKGSDGTTPTGSGFIVESQQPDSGVLVASGTVVTLTVVPATRNGKSVTGGSSGWVVCIDPGHQEHGDSTPEPIGPGSKQMRPRVAGGTTGVKTEIPEYEIALQISMNLKNRLEAEGVKVVMTRTTNDVNIGNAERAAVAARAKADLFVRIHGDGSPDSDVSGISTLYPASNTWTKSFAKRSKRAARLVQLSAVRATGAVSRGTDARGDLSGFNWAKTPCILVECGFLSNPVEDRLLASPHYQDKLAVGITSGIVTYLKEQDG